MRVELGEVEHVADETAEPLGLGGDDLQRLLGRLRVGDDTLAQRGDVPADRGQRRPQLVRDGHQEVALELLRLREPGRHLAEALGQVADLAAAPHRRDIHVVASLGDLVHRLREREHRLRDPPREVEREHADDDEPDEERDREPREQRDPASRAAPPSAWRRSIREGHALSPPSRIG